MVAAKPATPRRLRSADDLARHRPVHVVWELTLACNLRCSHCGSRAGVPRRDELTTEECLDIVRQLAESGTREISLIGGEAYLRRDWLTIVKAIRDAGMHCGMQTGGRALTEQRLRAAVDAGLETIGVSIDGPAPIHDELRGVPGSYDHALAALRLAQQVGLRPGVNTQINARSKPHLREVFDAIAENGARFWQVQLTVPMGNAADQAGLLLQPYEIVETIEVLADLFERGRRIGLRVHPGNNIGYFGPFEWMWRTLTTEPTHWTGCSAGETQLGLEADGTIKGCPSLPKERYSGGVSRNVSINDAVAALAPTTLRRGAGCGFCGSCYYWNVCHGGCTWMADALSGQRGDNPYCYYRARELAKRDLRERVIKVAEAPNHPFATGQFAIVLETATGQRMPGSLARDGKKRRRGRHLVLCGSCQEYLLASERVCPHCGSPATSTAAADDEAGDLVLGLVEQIEQEAQAMRNLIEAGRSA